jgi:DnaJ-domain-containing protein 1
MWRGFTISPSRMWPDTRPMPSGWRACAVRRANCAMLEDVLDGLFHIAKADGLVHQKELEFIANVADIFRVDEAHFERIMARHVHPDGIDPYAVLGVARINAV